MDKKNTVAKPEENFFDTLISHKLIFDIDANKKDGTWLAEGSLIVRGSKDGEKFGEVSVSVKSYDKDVNSALSTVMLSLGNFVSSEEFVTKLSEQLMD